MRPRTSKAARNGPKLATGSGEWPAAYNGHGHHDSTRVHKKKAVRGWARVSDLTPNRWAEGGLVMPAR